MNIIQQLINALLGIISAGTGFRIVYCAVRRSFAEEDEARQLKNRMKHSLIFFILSLSALSLSNIIKRYFG